MSAQRHTVSISSATRPGRDPHRRKGDEAPPDHCERPKPLVPICNRPIVEHQLHHLASRGIRDVTLALGYNADQFDGVVADAQERGINTAWSPSRNRSAPGALRWRLDQGVLEDRLEWQPAGKRTEAGLWEGADAQRDDVDIAHPAAIGDRTVLHAGAQSSGGRSWAATLWSTRAPSARELCRVRRRPHRSGRVQHQFRPVQGARVGDNAVISRSIVGPCTGIGRRTDAHP